MDHNKNHRSSSRLILTKGLGSVSKKDFLKSSSLNTRVFSLECLKEQHVGILRKKSMECSNKLTLSYDLEFLSGLRNYRSVRYRNGYPIRGQRTHSNGKTAKKANRYKKQTRVEKPVF